MEQDQLIEAIAEADYEAGRPLNPGRPRWADLDPANPTDAGVRAHCLRHARAAVDAIERAGFLIVPNPNAL